MGGLLRLMQLVSPALPVGAYAYSHGLEYAVAQGWVHDEDSTAEWVLGVAEHQVAPMDAALLPRLIEAWRDDDRTEVERWSNFLCAARETSELALEDHHMGIALARLLDDLGVEGARAWRTCREVPYPTLFALACARWGIGVHDAQSAFLMAFCENQVAGAIKLVPLGQTAGQRVLGRAIEHVPGWVERANGLEEDELGPLTPGVALASARHETQYSRLFRS